MSSLATLISFSYEYKLATLINREQETLLKYFFDLDFKKEGIGILEEELPQYYRYHWINPFR